MKTDVTVQFLKSMGVNDFSHPAFRAFWKQGYSVVREQDLHASLPDLEGDVFNPQANPDIGADQLRRERAAFRARIKKQGVWGYGLAKHGQPIYETFIWGFVGDDYFGSGYDAELFGHMQTLGGRSNEA